MPKWFRRLRTWLLVRLGLWRKRWRRGHVTLGTSSLYLARLPGRTWTYGLYTPAGLKDTQDAPLIVLLHGCRQRALGFAQASGWTQFGDRFRVRLLCPDQRRTANLFRCWNWFAPSAQGGHGELDVVTAMLDDAGSRVATSGVVVVGLSAGGALAALLAFHRAERLRAAISVAGLPLLGTLGTLSPQAVMRRGLSFSPSLALGSSRTACAPLAIIHGALDQVVNPRCSEQLLEQAIESQRRAGVAMHETRGVEPAVTDYRTDGKLLIRSIAVPDLAHLWTGGPGGHPFCEPDGPPLLKLCTDFLRDLSVID